MNVVQLTAETGTIVPIALTTDFLQVSAPGTVASLVLDLPAPTAAKQLTISVSAPITSFSIFPANGHTLLGTPSQVAPGTVISLTFAPASLTWSTKLGGVAATLPPTKINAALVPPSAAYLASNSLGQLVATVADDEVARTAAATALAAAQTAQTAAQAAGAASLAKASNLSDVASPGLARNHIDRGEVTLASGSTISTDCSLGNAFVVQLTTNATLANPSNLQAGAQYRWRLVQGGGAPYTLSFGSAFRAVGAAALSTNVGGVDMFVGYSDGSRVYGILTNFG